MTAITIADTAIRQDKEGRFSLNDLHRAAGGDQKHRPKYWLAGQQTQELVAELEKGGIPPIVKKQGVGTFVAKELVYAYAMWISPAFHIKVIRAYDTLVTQPKKQVKGERSTVWDRYPLYGFAVDTVLRHHLLFSRVYQLLNLFAGTRRFAEMTKEQVQETLHFADRFAIGHDTRADWQRIEHHQLDLFGPPRQPDIITALLTEPPARQPNGSAVMYGNQPYGASSMRVLDPCCGSRMFWFDRQHPDVVFGDIRHETLTVTDRSHGNTSGQRTLRIEPDVLLDFRALPYQDGTFKLVCFDPPHLIHAGPRSWLAAKYGKLSNNWRDDLRQGFAECFRVLDADGVLVFKWNETQIPTRDVLALTPVLPLFGHKTGRKGMTHRYVFMKPADATQIPQYVEQAA